MLVLADRGEPWQGLLFPVERAVHGVLRRSFPVLRAHPVLSKWLYLPASSRGFAGAAEEIVRRIADGDRRFGVEPKLRRLPRPRVSSSDR
ncbi:MAG: hypothetical protein ACREQY_12305 [Candidatus Binatia bacterium]